jgi:hypothetical protein
MDYQSMLDSIATEIATQSDIRRLKNIEITQGLSTGQPMDRVRAVPGEANSRRTASRTQGFVRRSPLFSRDHPKISRKAPPRPRRCR